MKDLVYAGKIQTVNHFRQRITAFVVTPTLDMHHASQHIWEEVDYRLNVCRALNGSSKNYKNNLDIITYNYFININ